MAFNDWRDDREASRLGPLEQVISITKHDTNSFAPLRAILFGADASVSLKTLDSSSVGAMPFLGRIWYPMAVTQVFTTGTDSVGIWGGR